MDVSGGVQRSGQGEGNLFMDGLEGCSHCTVLEVGWWRRRDTVGEPVDGRHTAQKCPGGPPHSPIGANISESSEVRFYPA